MTVPDLSAIGTKPAACRLADFRRRCPFGGNSWQEETTTSDPVPEQEESNNADVGTMVWIPATGEKYHSIPNCGRMNPDTARQVSRSEAEAMGYGPCSKCY